MDWLQTPIGVTVVAVMMGLVVVGASLLTLLLAVRWTNRMRDHQSRVQESQISYLRASNQTLLNLLLSKEPMTFSTLQAQTSYSDSEQDHHGLTPIGTDEAEAKRYQEIYGKDEGLDDDARDFAEFLTT